MLLKLYIITSLLLFAFIILMSYECKREYEKKFAKVVYIKFPLADRIMNIVKIITISFCPIINFIFLVLFIFAYDIIKEQTVNKLDNIVDFDVSIIKEGKFNGSAD